MVHFVTCVLHSDFTCLLDYFLLHHRLFVFFSNKSNNNELFFLDLF